MKHRTWICTAYEYCWVFQKQYINGHAIKSFTNITPGKHAGAAVIGEMTILSYSNAVELKVRPKRAVEPVSKRLSLLSPCLKLWNMYQLSLICTSFSKYIFPSFRSFLACDKCKNIKHEILKHSCIVTWHTLTIAISTYLVRCVKKSELHPV